MTGQHLRSLAEPAFPGDDGQIDPGLARVLGDEVASLAALGAARVFVAVVATLGSGGRSSGGADKDADMAAVFMSGVDGRRGLLVFSSLQTLSHWDRTARPVPVWGQAAALAAVQENASALLIDVGSAHFSVVETEDLHHLAAGDQLVQTSGGHAWVRPG